MKNLTELSLDELTNYESLTIPVEQYVRQLWNIRHFAPCAEENFAERKQKILEMPVDQQDELVNLWLKYVPHDAVTNDTDTMMSWCEALTSVRVVNEGEAFGIDPLAVLIRTTFQFGRQVEAEINKRKNEEAASAEEAPTEKKHIVFASQLTRDQRVHLSHCNQGDYKGSCKYGDHENCPGLHMNATIDWSA